jgi:hypothetical protein
MVTESSFHIGFRRKRASSDVVELEPFLSSHAYYAVVLSYVRISLVQAPGAYALPPNSWL